MVNNPQKTATSRGKAPPGTISITRGKPPPTAGQIADLSRQIRLAEAKGESTEELKKQLFEAVEQMK